jgi:hypothetical protein
MRDLVVQTDGLTKHYSRIVAVDGPSALWRGGASVA